jgi:hypothetical protein
MLLVKRTKHVEKFLLTTTGSLSGPDRAEDDRRRLSAILTDPTVRVIEVKDEKEQEKTCNDKGVIISLVEHTFRIVTYERESL